MAATADKYSKDTWNDKDTVSGQTTTKNIYAYIPLALTEYKNNPSNSSEATSTSDESFCSKFFCDSVMKFKDSEGKDCVLGLLDMDHTLVQGVWNRSKDLHILSEGGASRSRQGKLMINKNGTNYMVLNDGGLNTKPYIEISECPLCACTFVVLKVNYRNAYYFNTLLWKLRIEYFPNQSTYPATSYLTTSSHTNYMEIDSSVIPMLRKTAGNDLCVPVDLLRTSITEAKIGDKFRFTFFAYNDETLGVNSVNAQPYISNKGGTLNSPEYGVTFTVTTNVRPWVVKKIATPTTNPDDGVAYTILMDDNFYALKSVAGGLGLLEDGDTGKPNLMNLFFTAYLRKLPSQDSLLQSATESVDGTSQYGQSRSTEVFIHGMEGNTITGDIVNNYLPGGYYHGFTKDLETRRSEDESDDKSPGNPSNPEDPEWYKRKYVLQIHDTGQGTPDGRVINWYNGYAAPVVIPRAQFTSFGVRINSTAGSSNSSWVVASDNGGYDVYIYPIVTATVSNPASGARGSITVGVYKTIKQNGSTIDIRLAEFVVEVTVQAGNNGTTQPLPVDTINVINAGEPTQSELAIVRSNTLDSPSDDATLYTVRVTNSDPEISGGDYSSFVSTAVDLADMMPR